MSNDLQRVGENGGWSESKSIFKRFYFLILCVRLNWFV